MDVQSKYVYSTRKPGQIAYKQFIVRDMHQEFKEHVYRVYRDHHISYNQRICGRLFYSGFVRINKQSSVYEIYKTAMMRYL